MLLLLSMKKCHNLFHSLIEQNIHFTSCIKVLCQIFKNIWPPILQHSKHKTNIYSLFQMYNSISHTKKAWHRICYTDELYCTVRQSVPCQTFGLSSSTLLPCPSQQVDRTTFLLCNRTRNDSIWFISLECWISQFLRMSNKTMFVIDVGYELNNSSVLQWLLSNGYQNFMLWSTHLKVSRIS